MLLQLSSFPQIPRADRIVQSAGPQFRSVRRNVDAGGAVRVTLELSQQRLILYIPDGDVPVAAAAEADFRVGGDGQSVTSWRVRGQFRFDPWRWTRQVPNAEVARFTAYD